MTRAESQNSNQIKCKLGVGTYNYKLGIVVPSFVVCTLHNRVECGNFFWSDRIGQLTKGQAWF